MIILRVRIETGERGYNEVEIDVVEFIVWDTNFVPCRGLSIVSGLKEVADIRRVHQHFYNHLSQLGRYNWL
jgi:hypothetical protein